MPAAACRLLACRAFVADPALVRGRGFIVHSDLEAVLPHLTDDEVKKSNQYGMDSKTVSRQSSQRSKCVQGSLG